MQRQLLKAVPGTLCLLTFLFLLSSAAFAGDFRVIPGRRIGAVVLGRSRVAVHARLHAPSTTRRLRNGLIVDTWLSHALLPPSAAEHGNYLKRDYLTVFYQSDRAVQIEASAPQFKTPSGLSTRSSSHDFARQYPHYRQPHRLRFAPGPNGFGPYEYGPISPDASSPAGKHFLVYGDAVRQGIAWKSGAWGDLAPDPDPDGPLEAVIVHMPGETVLLNPNDGLPYAGTGPARK